MAEQSQNTVMTWVKVT